MNNNKHWSIQDSESLAFRPQEKYVNVQLCPNFLSMHATYVNSADLETVIRNTKRALLLHLMGELMETDDWFENE